jgi:threonylcarbamoyladenosine tRNA methylthiotransferase MtaB
MRSERLRPLELDDSWGDGRPRPLNFEDLVRAILEYTSLEKLRISSVEPMDWSDSFIRLMANSPRIAKHAHVPMQSGSDTVLRLMHRKYRPWHYRQKIEMIRAAMPTAAIGADAMVGFPGESDFEFEETRSMIAELPFTYLHVFTFSARPGTPAATMTNQVPIQVARERNRILRELAARKKRAFMQQFVSQKIEAITLNVISDNARGTCTEALTDNYLKMKLIGRLDANQWLRADVIKIDDDMLIGTPTGKLASEVEDPKQTGITRAPSQKFTCQETIPTRPAA